MTYFLLAVGLAALVAFLTGLMHLPTPQFYAVNSGLCVGLAIAAWYAPGQLIAAAWFVVLAAWSAWRAAVSRRRPGWWNGAHERVEQT